jgi:cytochrome c553
VLILDTSLASRTMQNDGTLAIPFPAEYRPTPITHLGMKRAAILGWVVLANAGCLADGGSAASPSVGETASGGNAGGSGALPGSSSSGVSTGSSVAVSGSSTTGPAGGTGTVTNPASGASTGTAPGIDAGAHSGSGDAGPGYAGLPCDVAQLLVTRCTFCHGAPPTPPSPMPLMTNRDLTRPSLADPNKTYAQEAVIRMQNATLPMPPAPYARATFAEIGILQNWIGAGYPQGACGGPMGPSDGGGPADEAGMCPSPVPPIMDTPVMCTSNMKWTGGNGAQMRPGEACLNCHGGKFAVAGTVYPTLHERDDCYGVNGSRGVTVVITDMKGMSYTLNPNNVGNFTLLGSIPLPYRAKVLQAGKTRSMMTPQMDGNCNSCHSEAGYCAPGRLMIP